MAMAEGGEVVKVKSIYIYPIKSCGGISVPHAPLSSTGFRWDRQWLVVNSKGRAYTQRIAPKLALVQLELPNDAFLDAWQPTTPNSAFLVIRAPGMDALKVDLWKAARGERISDGVSVWEWSGSAFDEGEEAAKWFSDYLGKPSRLVRFNPDTQVRGVDPNYADGYKIMFSDQAPFLIISQGSMDALNKLLEEPIPINRFRPNIYVDGCEPFSEDLWTEIKINKFTFYGVRLCSRCKVPRINQEDASLGSEPTETLKKYRSDKVLQPSKTPKGLVYMGQCLVCKESLSLSSGEGEKMIKVGDSVSIIKKVPSSEYAVV